MHRALSQWLLGLLFGSLLIGVYGCAGRSPGAGLSSWLFGPKSDTVPGLIAPADRIAAIRKGAEAAASAGPDRQEQVARDMAAQLSKESDPLIRLEMVRAVGGFQSATATLILRAALKDADTDVRVVACKAWAKRRGPEAVQTLGEVLLSDADIDVRLAAARALGQTGDRGAVAALGKSLDDRDPTMQYYAVDSLRKISGQDFGNDVGKWRQYAKGETPAPAKPPSLADRIYGFF
jgi:HEAT repeat protein